MSGLDQDQKYAIFHLESDDQDIVADKTFQLYSKDISAWYRGILEDSKQKSKGQFIVEELVRQGIVVKGKEAEAREVLHSEAPELFVGAVIALPVKESAVLPKEAPILWKDRKYHDQLKFLNPADFIHEVYKDYIGTIKRSDIERLDKSLYVRLSAWLNASDVNKLTYDLPTRSELTDRWVERVSSDPTITVDLKTASRYRAAVHRREQRER